MKGYGTTRLRYGHLTYIAQILVFFQVLEGGRREEKKERNRETEGDLHRRYTLRTNQISNGNRSRNNEKPQFPLPLGKGFRAPYFNCLVKITFSSQGQIKTVICNES
jgi:hypothetical protein